MAIADKYKRENSFTQHSVVNPDVPHSGPALDVEFDSLANVVGQIITQTSKVVQDDGRVQGEVIYLRNLAPEVFAFFEQIVNGEFTIVIDPNAGDGSPGGGSQTLTSGLGILAFTQAIDTPRSYAGHGGKAVYVKQTEDGLEFRPLDFPEVRLQNATDLPDFEGNALRFFRVNAAEDASELVLLPIDPAGQYARLDEDNDWQGNVQENPVMGRYTEKLVDLGNVSGVVNIDPSTGNVFKCVATGDVTFQFSANPGADRVYSFSIQVECPSSVQVQMPGADWGYKTNYTFDVQNEAIVETVEAKPAPILPAGSKTVLGGIMFSDGTINAFTQ